MPTTSDQFLNLPPSPQDNMPFVTEEYIIEAIPNNHEKIVNFYIRTGVRFSKSNGILFITLVSGNYNNVDSRFHITHDDNGWSVHIKAVGNNVVVKGAVRALIYKIS